MSSAQYEPNPGCPLSAANRLKRGLSGEVLGLILMGSNPLGFARDSFGYPAAPAGLIRDPGLLKVRLGLLNFWGLVY